MADKYNNDSTLRELIRSFIETKLNEAGIVEGQDPLEFVVGKDFLQTDDNLVKQKLVDGTFRTVKEKFVIGMIEDFLGIPEPVKGYEMIAYTIPMVLLVSTKTNYDVAKDSIDRFIKLLIGEDYIVSGHFFGTNCSEATNTEQVVDINGIEYVKYAITVFVTTSVKAIIGNFVETYLGPVTEAGLFDETNLIRIYPTDRSTARAYIPEETHKNDKKESTTIFKESTWAANLSIIIDNRTPLLREFVVELEEPTKLNKPYSYRVVYPFIKIVDEVEEPDPLVTDKVILTENIGLDAQIGDYVLMNMKLKISGM